MKFAVLACALLSTSLSAAASPALRDSVPEDEPVHADARYRLRLELPILDTRSAERVSSATMRQSLAFTKDAYYLAHLPALALSEHLGGGEALAVGLVDIALGFLPLGNAWLHEEWHRSLLARRGFSSHNGVYDFEFGAFTRVSDVSDDDLSALKRDHPAEMVRLSSAGLEAQYMLGLQFDKDRFFHGTRAGTVFQQWYDVLTAIAYVSTSAYDSDATTAELRAEEGADVSARDFAGLDPVAWVYDLHRPGEPYAARGVHPSGVGVDRYRSESDLTRDERSYLRTQSWLSFLNLLNPNLIGLHAFELEVGGRQVRWNASVQHFLTSFGSSTNLNAFLQVDSLRWFFQVHAHANQRRVLPGLSAELITPSGTAGLTPSIHLWLQPEGQSFFTNEVQPGGAVELRSNLALGAGFQLYSVLSAKSEGWLAGNEYLDAEWSALLGIETIAY